MKWWMVLVLWSVVLWCVVVVMGLFLEWLKFEGDQRVLMAYLLYVKLVLAAPRNA
jgi:hypothetical protein